MKKEITYHRPGGRVVSGEAAKRLERKREKEDKEESDFKELFEDEDNDEPTEE